MSASSRFSLRLITGVVVLALVLFCLWRGGLFWVGLLALVGMVALAEMWRLHRGAWSRSEGLLSLLALPVLLGAAALGWLEIGIALLAATCLLAAFFVARAGRSIGFPLLLLPSLLGGLMLVAYLGVGGGVGEIGDGTVLLLYLLAVVVCADSGAYCVGSIVKGPRLAPKISPHKTWSGGIGAIACGGIAGAVAGMFAAQFLWQQDAPFLPLLLVGAGAALVSQLGDLLESALKRRIGAKDSGALLPGHGGVLDRIDSLLAGLWFLVLFGWGREALQGNDSFNAETILRGVLAWT